MYSKLSKFSLDKVFELYVSESPNPRTHFFWSFAGWYSFGWFILFFQIPKIGYLSISFFSFALSSRRFSFYYSLSTRFDHGRRARVFKYQVHSFFWYRLRLITRFLISIKFRCNEDLVCAAFVFRIVDLNNCCITDRKETQSRNLYTKR